MKEYLTASPAQTKKLGEILAKEILKTRLGKKALVIGLEGDLGGGKTTFLQGFAKGLRIKEKILSPTFVILKKFEISQRTSFFRIKEEDLRGGQNSPKQSLEAQQACYGVNKLATGQTKFKIFYHIDCYRIRKSEEILVLGFKEIISNSQNIIAIEWPKRIQKILPKKLIKIKFKLINKNTRCLVISYK